MIRKVILTPFQKFVKIEGLSGILLFGATIFAMLWANSGYSDVYEWLWDFKIGITSDSFSLSKPLILWINDGLMAIFFFLIGLEIKRELLIGELNSFKKAALPLFAAIGGVIFPLVLFMVLNDTPETFKGWGIPMATDIAFTLAILNLLGNRVPLSLKIFLTAFAIVDDLVAVLVIAVFYSETINWILILYASICFIPLVIAEKKGYYSKYLTTILGVIIWVLFLKSGIHPTIAGVLLAFTVPVRQKVVLVDFIDNLKTIAERIIKTEKSKEPILSYDQIQEMDNLEELTEKFRSPLQYLEHKLHGWSAYFIMPLFALANAGVAFSSNMEIDMSLILNIAIALFVGKCIGIALLSYLSIKLKWAQLPSGTNFTQIIGVAILAGVGFTMSIFIANLAFYGEVVYVNSSKVGVISGSILSGIIGYFILRWSGRKELSAE
ncbi:Na+/H+ antiporter NhaA [Cellulophaga sp. Hel_I_12]|uniref:Na+/H+ antiporter NhaA n=1 Tax=Cellulophaga sp. Hel_I_12 TaxID=1249972 RepID=UPI00064589A7|nr:Na+/H+ antiporter NhaA [Cellulophaga sp. Hel_I_12]